ncbi:uncharacterized protein C5orf47 homolog [Myotis myotis]|nr:uncharacterized protein C5orf47 homolog [Myotis myotis]
MAKAAAGRKQERDPARFVYVPRFGSHQCGGVLRLGGRRAGERGAAGARGEGQLPPGSEPGAPAASSAARASSARSSGRAAARAGLAQKMLARKFEFPVHFSGASKVMKKKEKVSVWKKVHKVISRMLEENENYRLRLKRQRLAGEN